MSYIKFNTTIITNLVFSLNRLNRLTPQEIQKGKTTAALVKDLEGLYSSDEEKNQLIEKLEQLTPLPKSFRGDMETLKESLVDLDLIKESVEDLIS
jgi:hypothetical protein